jgi:ABC-type transport system substrate-binding protein
VVWLRNDVWWHTPQVDLARHPHLAGKHRLTAHDVKFTLDLILNRDVDAAHTRNYYSECEGIEVIDDFCYLMRWRKPQFNSIAFTLNLEPIPKFVFGHDEGGEPYDEGQIGHAFNKHWFYEAGHYCGCGPYFVAEYEPGRHLLLRRFEDYYGQKPPIFEIWSEFFPDAETAAKKVESGEHDFHSLQMKEYEKKVVKEKGQNPFSDGRMGEFWTWGVSYSFIAWKNTHPIFRDARVREAMTWACDRPRIVRDLELDQARLSTGPQLPGGPFADPTMEPTPFDLSQARTILAEAGWTDTDGDGLLDKEIDGVRTPFRFTAMVPNNQLFIPIFEIFKEDLRKIGVQMDIDLLFWKQFKERLDARTFECTALVWSTDGWESDCYQIWHSSQADEVPSSNFIEFRDPEADRMMETLRETFEFEDRVRMQRELHRRIGSQHPYTFLMRYRIPVFWWKDRIGNFEAGCDYVDRPNVRLYPMTRLAPR